LPDHTVEVEKYLKDTEYVDELVISDDETAEEERKQDFIVSISIKGSNS